MKCLARQARCARAVQLGHSSQLSFAGSSHSAQRTASFAASRASLVSRSAIAPSRDPLPALALHARHSCYGGNPDAQRDISWPARQPKNLPGVQLSHDPLRMPVPCSSSVPEAQLQKMEMWVKLESAQAFPAVLHMRHALKQKRLEVLDTVDQEDTCSLLHLMHCPGSGPCQHQGCHRCPSQPRSAPEQPLPHRCRSP